MVLLEEHAPKDEKVRAHRVFRITVRERVSRRLSAPLLLPGMTTNFSGSSRPKDVEAGLSCGSRDEEGAPLIAKRPSLSFSV